MKRMRHLAERTLGGGLIRTLLGFALFLQVLGAGIGFGMAPATASAAANEAAASWSPAGVADESDQIGQLVLICTPDGTRLVALPASKEADGKQHSGAMAQGCPFCLVAAYSAGALGEPAAITLTLHPAEFESEAAPVLPPRKLVLSADFRRHPAEPRAPPAFPG
jgi:hypothetical protein